MEVYFLWAVLFAAFFFDRRRTARHLALSGLAYGAALAMADPAGLPVLRWVFVMTGVALVGVLVRLRRYRRAGVRGHDPGGGAQRVRLAGMLHDIGKISIPGAILRKQGPLNEAEWREMRRHPELGGEDARRAWPTGRARLGGGPP
jgi:HD domain